MTTDPQDLPLSGIVVLDAAEGAAQMIGRYLADLGAEVIRVEPPGGSRDRREGVRSGDVSLTFALANANKRAVAVEPGSAAGRDRLLELGAHADIVLSSSDSPYFSPSLFSRESAPENFPGSVVLVFSDFGLTGPQSGWVATPWVHLALSTVLSRSGLPEMPTPLLPPQFLAYGAAVPQAVWATMLALANAWGTGRGDFIDFSAQEGIVLTLDPPIAIGGSARAGQPLRDLPPGRPDARHLYPIFPSQDGYVRICVLSPRQWGGMFSWLGEPEEFADPKFASLAARFGAVRTLYPLIGRLFGGLTSEEAVRDGQSRGVPVAAVASLSEALAQPAFAEAGGFSRLALEDGRTATVPAGVFEIDGSRAGLRRPAPELAEVDDHPGHGAGVRAGEMAVALAPRTPGMPFSGLRVLDLGVIVVGAELGRLFADYGADVIKVESADAVDGSRQTLDGSEISESFAWGHRNKRSLGLNLKSEHGRALFTRLVEHADIVLTNFKPGTLEGLGLGYDRLAEINPGIILSESSAFGNSGPWSGRLGYGPLVRASTGLSALWRYVEQDDSFSDAITIYPDHVVARLNAAAIVALLLRRQRTGRGGRVASAQVDAIFTAMGDQLALESLAPGTISPTWPDRLDAPAGLFAAAGEDQWLVVDGAGDDRFRALAGVIGRSDWMEDPGLADASQRLARAGELESVLGRWVAGQDPVSAERDLQAAGVPAGRMMRVDDLLGSEQLRARGLFAELSHPLIAYPLATLASDSVFEHIAEPDLRPAPRLAEHTTEILHEVLGLDGPAVGRLLEEGAAEIHPESDIATTS